MRSFFLVEYTTERPMVDAVFNPLCTIKPLLLQPNGPHLPNRSINQPESTYPRGALSIQQRTIPISQKRKGKKRRYSLPWDIGITNAIMNRLHRVPYPTCQYRWTSKAHHITYQHLSSCSSPPSYPPQPNPSLGALAPELQRLAQRRIWHLSLA